MKFSNVFALGLATLAVATPIATPAEKRDLSVSGIESSLNSTIASLDSTTATIITGVEGLLGKIVSDVEALAAAAGVDPSELLASTGISLSKRDAIEGLEARDDQAVIDAATALITDTLEGLVTLSTATGTSLFGSLLSILNL